MNYFLANVFRPNPSIPVSLYLCLIPSYLCWHSEYKYKQTVMYLK